MFALKENGVSEEPVGVFWDGVFYSISQTGWKLQECVCLYGNLSS